jgi:plasmid stability protein
MVIHMKTTLNIDDSVMQRLREEAARRGTTMSQLVEAGLRRILGEEAVPGSARRQLRPLPRWRSGGARVDVADRDALHDLMDGR